MKRIEWYEPKHGLNEAVTTGIQFAFVSLDGKQCCQFVYCKDFLHDAVQAVLLNRKRTIYQFDYDPKKDPQVSTDKMRLVVVNSQDQQLREKIPACLDFLHQIEERLGILKTVVTECADPPAKYKLGGAFHFLGSRRWIIAPPMVSLYTLLIRVGMGHTVG